MDGPDPHGGYSNAATVFLAADDPASIEAAEQAAALAGTRVVARSDFQHLGGALPLLAALDIVLIEAGRASPGELDRLLLRGQSLAEQYGARLVVCFSEGQLDQVAAQVTASGMQLLCEPDVADRVAALAIAGRPTTVQFHSSVHEHDNELRRLSEEVARIAEAIKRMSPADGHGGGIRGAGNGHERPGFAAQQADGHGFELPHGTRHDGAGEQSLPQPAAIRSVIRARRLRAQFFDAQLFADPAWDMLLDLMAARLERASVSVSSLCIAAAVPPTTALRWITTMTEAGLFEREDDPLDRRRAYIALTETAFEGMRGYTAAVKRMGLAIF
ncbi:hypothetical protein ACBY01_12680 [Sphingomonas sp. ac-8]|uniref:hypothetical protein n=1 Tax=Sphingomonas sp. ac-8 TaxID=3242977 RepID=UPI003A80C6D7